MGKAKIAAGTIVGFLLGAAIGEIAPEPTDPLFIWLSDWLKVNQTLIPVWQYWSIWFFNYYALSAIWYLFLVVLILSVDLPWTQRSFLGIGLLSAGMVVGLIGYLITGRDLPGVSNLGLGYLIVFAMIGALTALSATILLYFREETVGQV